LHPDVDGFSEYSIACRHQRVARLLILIECGRARRGYDKRRYAMLHYALVFLVIALIAAALGFGGIAGAAAGIAKLLFLVFIVLFLVSLVVGGLRRF
jgi:uncharacterized membrane protein YtjA (UPF0391 family)